MIDDPITSKSQMYSLLLSGALGNSTPQFMSLEAWEASPDYHRYHLWGIRTLQPGGPCRMYCPRDDVRQTVTQYRDLGCAVNISVMLDAIVTVTAYMDVYDSDRGLIVRAVEYPGKGESWRIAMPQRGIDYHGIAARMLLHKHLDPGSLEDLWALFDRWPGHVVELSACDRCFGTHSNRRAIVWEVRLY